MIKLPQEYLDLSEEETHKRILEQKAKRAGEMMILGHHYQRASIVDIADQVGDSFGLAKAAAEASTVKDIVFCGVRFMAESAAILCRDDQKVFHPEPEAGCPMADMAPMESVEEAWVKLNAREDLQGRRIIPVTYMNSHAPLKAFTGKHGGAVCTSSNARKVIEWAWEQGDIVLFFPDEKLGYNTGKTIGLEKAQMPIWYPSKEDGALETLDNVKMLLWNGHCPVHMKFTLRDVKNIRQTFPKAKIVVHPECEPEVVEAADADGSTSFIVEYLKKQEKGTMVFVGTEMHLIERMKRDVPDVRIELLFRSLCPTMYMVNLKKVLYCLENLESQEAVPMPAEIKDPARLSLERMLALP